jgi:thymidine kinase
MTGRIEVICGPMFSGKSSELLRRLKRASIAKQEVQVFKPTIDDRYSDNKISTHEKAVMDAVLVDTASEILASVVPETKVIGIDEGQFLGPELPEVCDALAQRGVRVIVCGLDQDFSGRPFSPMPEMLAIADEVLKLDAICMVCGDPATKTYRKSRNAGLVEVGGADSYEARCRKCHAHR